ncbi:MAG: phosphoribosylglycinamide formyltransferase [Armatimonadota bacterium]|nr:phosphoribosylglycinamide formyltransferase [Armatimonadota bacterium]MDR7533597.1 phosphoribosylglycinamide formyltransferase [Armatimonadota bacterium]MDR7537396.1 phosphoribosylglycinamide formyltransferase [Armatimonadota bacterium]
MMRLAVYVSGSGTILQALLDAFGPGRSPAAEVALVVSNNPDAFALTRARSAGVPVAVVDHRGRSRHAFEADLVAATDAHRVNLVCLAGFLRILSPAFVGHYPDRILNTHPALLPAFGGRGMYGERVHEAVLAAGAAVSGCTIHLVDEVPDGGPIVAQATVPVLPGDTPATLAARVQAEERRLYPEVVRWWAEGRLVVRDRAVLWLPRPEAAAAPNGPAHARGPTPARAREPVPQTTP